MIAEVSSMKVATPQGSNGPSAPRRRTGIWLAWSLVAVLLLSLLSVFSGGFFLYAVLVVGGLLLASTTLVSLSVLGLQVERQIDGLEIPLGGSLDASLRLSNGKAWPALWLLWREQVEDGLDVEGSCCAFESLTQHGESTFRYRLHSTRRGLYRVGPAMIEASGPFGLVKRFLVAGEPEFVTVYPRAVPLGQGWPLGHRPIHQVPRRRSLFEDPSRFFGVRAYRPGDSLRRIHWRATARSSEIQVKVFEPMVLDGILLAVEMSKDVWFHHGSKDPLGEQGNVRQELAVTTAVSLAEWVLGGGQAVGLVSNGADAAERYAEDWTGGHFRHLDEAVASAGGRRRLQGHRPLEVAPSQSPWQTDRLRTALARLVEAPGPTLGEMLQYELPRLPRNLVLMVVTPQLDNSLMAALEALQRSGFEIGVLWITSPRRRGGPKQPRTPSVAPPPGVVIYDISDDTDLETLASQRL